MHGQPAFQGDQDDDPLNGTDCREGSPGAGPVDVFGDLPQVVAQRDDEVHIAELQVFSSTGGAGGGGGPPPPPPPGPPPPPPPPHGGGDDCEEDDDIVKLGPVVAAPGSTIEYTITYGNRHGDDDDDCEVEDRLPDDLTYVSSTEGGDYDATTRTVTWRLGDVSGDLTKTVSVTGTVSPFATIGSTLVNQALFAGLVGSPVATTATMVMP